MRIPKKLDVLGDTVKISLDERIEQVAGEGTLGLADLVEGKIFIHKGLSQRGKEYILLHEYWHHALWLSGIDQTLTTEQVESLCQTFATVYRQLCRQKVVIK